MVVCMYRILLVDPDKDSRDLSVNIIKNMGFDIALQSVASYDAAIEFAANGCVDILITEIKVEGIDGFSLVNELKSINENIRFIVLSTSNEFNDVKRAIKAGATDYLHKPLDKKELIEAVSAALEQCEEAKYISEQKEIKTEFVYEYVLLSMLYGKKFGDIHIENGSQFSESDFDVYGRILLLEFENEFFDKSQEDFVEKINALFNDEKIIAHYLNLNANQSVILFDRTMENSMDEEGWLKLATKIQRKIETKHASKCCVAVSSQVGDGVTLSDAMEEVEELMEGKFYESKTKVFAKQAKEESPVFVQADDDTIVKRIRQDIKLKDVDDLKKNFQLLWERYGSKTNLSQIYIKFVFSNILKEFYEALPSVGELELNDEIDTLYRSQDLSAVREIMEKNISRLEETFKINPQSVHREVECVKQYIYNHYGEEIGVEQLAGMVYMAPSYLSCVFKKETGQNLSKFIKAYRMEKAKEMLENSHKKIVNISNEVGYPNVSYFCQSFREYYGVSPQKYRNVGENSIVAIEE